MFLRVWEETIVLHILGVSKWFWRCGSYSPLKCNRSKERLEKEIYQASSPSILSLSGGGSDYRGIYDIGFKGAFMGYRPFIDSPP
jgi:hypothetical protein